MTLDLPPEAEQFREAVRTWLGDHPSPSFADLADAGYTVPHWPRPWGRDASPLEQLAIDEVLREHGVNRPINPIGLGWAGPTILHAGTPEQQEEFLPGIVEGREIWCQLFSEPGSGSDLASLRTRAVLDGDEWVITGQKIWTSLAHFATWGILIARTDWDAPKHRGITYFVCPMNAEGIEIRPIIEMTRDHTFNEVFLEEVRIPAANVIGEVNRGWDLAKVTLANERVSLSSGGAIWGQGPTADDLIDSIKKAGPVSDTLHRQRVVDVWMEGQVLQMLRARLVASALSGKQPGPEASIRKVMADEHGKHLFDVARDLAGAWGLLWDAGPYNQDPALWTRGFFFSPALTVGGGTTEVQKGIIGERVLGLPRDPDVTADVPFREVAAG
ncbi:MAG: acyl-CoA dehydrogenase family protein [Actinobacteria bacterium]|nr:acyl-CoA dehydrogenase family protein [Actinomycetota bacterium]